MSEQDIQTVECRLEEILGCDMPARPAENINAALLLAERIQGMGFSFELKDLCARSLYESAWRAVFAKGEAQFAAEDAQAAVAVCVAALRALGSGAAHGVAQD